MALPIRGSQIFQLWIFKNDVWAELNTAFLFIFKKNNYARIPQPIFRNCLNYSAL